jgi:phage N-6-adenine-methyltransferase
MISFNTLSKSHISSDYQTPLDFFNKIDSIFQFDIDVATTEDNPLGTPRFYTQLDDSFRKSWDGNCWCNPPFGKNLGIKKWIGKMQWEYCHNEDRIYCMLLPARVETVWFQDSIWRCRMIGKPLPTTIHFVKGRLKFVNALLNKNRNPHIMGSMLWFLGDINKHGIKKLNELIPGITIKRNDIL